MEEIKDKLKIIRDVLDRLYPHTSCFLKFNNDYELLFAVILSAQALDSSVNKVTPILFEKYPSLESLTDADIEEVINIIKPVGLCNNKGKNIVKTARVLHETYNDILPRDMLTLRTLPGVGYKTAGVVLAELYNYPIIPVDTHIFRVMNRVLFETAISDADSMSKVLTNNFEFDNHINFHRQVILFGRNICTAKKPKCLECPLNSYCHYINKVK